MSKELNKIYIGGISFTVYEKEYTPQVYYWDITDAYDKPSEIKKKYGKVGVHGSNQIVRTVFMTILEYVVETLIYFQSTEE